MSDETPISLKFPKAERLKSRKDIGQLFKSKKSVFGYPVKLIYRIIEDSEEDEIFQVAFSVPKRSFKKAVDRNLLKRRMKESYRLHRNSLKNYCKSKNICLQMMIIYTGKEECSYLQVEKGIVKGLGKLESSFQEQSFS